MKPKKRAKLHGSNDLRNAEPESDVEVDADTASNGANTSSSYGDNITEEQQQRSADSSSTMAENTQMDEASNVGNQQTRNARTTHDSGGREAGMTADAAARNTAKSDRENSWGKAMGDAVESGITEGGKSFGQAFGGAAADQAIGAIFGPSKEDSDSSGGSSGKSVAQSGASGATSGGGSAKGKKKPQGNRGDGRGSGGAGGEGEDGDVLISTGSDTPINESDLDDPIGVRGTSQNNDGTVTITYGCGYTWTGKPPGPSRCPICSRETISTESNSPEEEEEWRENSSDSSSDEEDNDSSSSDEKPETKPEKNDGWQTINSNGTVTSSGEISEDGTWIGYDEHIWDD